MHVKTVRQNQEIINYTENSFDLIGIVVCFFPVCKRILRDLLFKDTYIQFICKT